MFLLNRCLVWLLGSARSPFGHHHLNRFNRCICMSRNTRPGCSIEIHHNDTHLWINLLKSEYAKC